ncbi:uncharacterized protein [Apostichopus japonicus]
MYNLTSKDKPPPTLGTIIRHYVKRAGPLAWILIIALIICLYMAYTRIRGQPYSGLDSQSLVKESGHHEEDIGPNLAVMDQPDLDSLPGGGGKNEPEIGADHADEDTEMNRQKMNQDSDDQREEDGKENDLKLGENDVQELDIGDQRRKEMEEEIFDKLKQNVHINKEGEEKEKPKIPFNVHNHDLDEVDEDYIIAQQHNKDPNAMPVLPKFDPNRHIHGALPEGEVFYPLPKVFPVAEILTPKVEECPTVNPFLLVIVVTHANQSKHRNSIRRTWGKPSNFQKVALRTAMPWWVIFSMGTEDGTEESIREEQKAHGDILQGDFVDHESEETRKTMQAFKWIAEHLPASCRPSFILKTECSIFVNTPVLTKWITEHFSQSLATYVGKLIRDDVPIRDLRSSLYVPEHDYIRDVFPSFIQGPSYLLSMDVVTAMAALFRQITPIAMEDAYIGLLAEKLGQAPKNEDKFKVTDRPQNVCHYLEMMMMRVRKATVHHQIFNVVNHRDPTCTGPRDL